MCLKGFFTCMCVFVYMYNFCTAVVPGLSSTGACIVINSTSGGEQINGGCTVMECMVKGSGMGEWRDGEQTQKDVNVGQERREREVGTKVEKEGRIRK